MDSKKLGMIYSVKDSLIFLMVVIVAVIGYTFVKGSGYEYAYQFAGLVIAVFFSLNILAALGASMFNNSSYHANKEKYSVGVALFDEDKKSSVFHLVIVVFFACMGLLFYPFALITGGVNYKMLFVKDEAYEEQTTFERATNELVDDLDIEVKGNKKWKISLDAFTNYYFHTDDEAYKYALENKIHPKFVKRV